MTANKSSPKQTKINYISMIEPPLLHPGTSFYMEAGHEGDAKLLRGGPGGQGRAWTLNRQR